MKTHDQEIGSIGEELAIQYLVDKGFSILKHHYTMHWGELDIIAKREDRICFIEVKTRVGTKKGKPYESISYFKKKHILRTAEWFLSQNKLRAYKYSLDVVSIILNPDFSVQELLYFQGL